MKIIIIGGGASGILALYHLVNLGISNESMALHLVEKENDFGGLAYNLSALPLTVLNTQIHSMSAFEDKPDDLLEWLNSPSTDRTAWPSHLDRSKQWDKSEFCPRQLYGFYLRDILKEILVVAAKKNIPISLHHDEVVDIHVTNPARISVSLKNGKELVGNASILCLGQLNGEKLPFHCDSHDDPKFIREVWNQNGIKNLLTTSAEEDVLVIGTGLTANDVVVHRKNKIDTLASNPESTSLPGHTYLLSRHACLHLPYPKDYKGRTGQEHKLLKTDELASFDIHSIKPQVKESVLELQKKGLHSEEIYRALVKELLPLWKQLPKDKRRAIFSKYKYLDIYRTGVSMLVAECMEEMKSKGQLSVLAADIVSITKESDKFLVKMLVKSKDLLGTTVKHPEELKVDRIFNATGFESSITACSSPLVNKLLDKNMLRQNYLGLGVDCSTQGQLYHNNANILLPLFAIGALTTGQTFENTGRLGSSRSMTGIRRQSVTVAASVIAYLQQLNIKHSQIRLFSKAKDSACSTVGKIDDKLVMNRIRSRL